MLTGIDSELRALRNRLRAEATGPQAREECERLIGLAAAGTTEGREELARLLVAPGQPLWALEIAAFVLGSAGDRRAFEALILLLNHRDPPRGASAARALARLRDPRTPRAAAALATNPLRTAYAFHPIRLLVTLRAPESVPALMSTLRRLLVDPDHHWPIARACVQGLGELGDPRAVGVLTAARRHVELREAATAALTRITGRESGRKSGGLRERRGAGRSGASEAAGTAERAAGQRPAPRGGGRSKP